MSDQEAFKQLGKVVMKLTGSPAVAVIVVGGAKPGACVFTDQEHKEQLIAAIRFVADGTESIPLPSTDEAADIGGSISFDE